MSSVVGYMDFGGAIKGNSDDAKHKEWIELMSVRQNVNRNIDPTSKPKDALSKSQVQVGGIALQKNADESSPELIAAVCEGKVFPEVSIDLVKVTDGGNEAFYTITLTNAYVFAYDVSGMAHGSISTTENLTLNYDTIKWSYKKTGADGKAAGAVETGWNLATNSKN